MDIKKVLNEVTKEIEQSSSQQELQNIKVAYLGKKGKITELLKSLKDLSLEEKKSTGAKLNSLRRDIDDLFKKYDNQSLINYYSDFIPKSTQPNDESIVLQSILKDKLQTKLLSTTEIIRNRIDALGVTEPLIQTKGVNQIIIELAGVQDTSRAESLIKNTILLIEDPAINLKLKNIFII